MRAYTRVGPEVTVPWLPSSRASAPEWDIRYHSVVTVGPASASEPPTATLEFALGIPTTLLELLLYHLR
jgi:hypothetical protein